MTLTAQERARWIVVVVFAAGMAWVESACVYYLRVLVDRVNPYQPVPLPIHAALGPVELVREAATLVMLLTVGMLAGRTLRSRLGYASIAFGVWDLLYYVFLRVICGWPRSLFDWDILFLLPLPWWGPVIAPCGIAVLMIVWGTCVTQWPDSLPAGDRPRMRLASAAAGIALALYVFMADALAAVHAGADAALVLPVTFSWPLFSLALILMAAAVWPARQPRTPGPRAQTPPILLAPSADHRATRSLT
jgi:hypothetical protein